jgi:integrase
MALAGVPMIEIARMLGHRDSRITERVYAKHSPDYLRRAVEALSA